MNRMKYIGILLAGVAASCTSSKQPITEALPHEVHAPLVAHKAQMNALTSWKLSGALAAKNKRKGWTATIDWQQQGMNSYQMRLFGPLGSGAILIERNKGLVTYTDGPKKITSNQADTLMQKEMGIQLPINNLYYWVGGIPAPGPVQSATHDQNNHLASLKQSGYTIDYLDYTSINGYDLPTKIRLEGSDILLKLIIKRWEI